MKRWFLVVTLTCGLLAGCNQGNWSSGDRVVVSKFSYETNLAKPERFDVVVFKYPDKPTENGAPKNYIKRLLGLPGEIIAIFFGRLFHWHPTPGEPAPFDDSQVKETDRWQEMYMHSHDEKPRKWFDEGKFEIIRKPPHVMMAMRRIVFDNDYQPKDLVNILPPRWNPAEDSSWKAQDQHKVFSFAGEKKGKVDWLHYQHLLRPNVGHAGAQKLGKPQLITDFLGYNSIQLAGMVDKTPAPNWVGDLMLECELTVDKAEGEFWLELSKGSNRFQARWDLATGICTLFRRGLDGKAVELDSKPTRVKSTGTYSLRLANFDARLTLWVNRELPFGDGKDYPPPEIRGRDEKDEPPDVIQKRRGPTVNDLEPASVGSLGAAVKVAHLRLWRDTYYTLGGHGADANLAGVDWHDFKSWDGLRQLDFRTLYVQPGHYLCLGDNSPQSSDGRSWGLVPQRLMLGRALMVYYPFDRAGPIR